MIWRKRIPPTGRRKLNLEESQNKFAYQVRNFAELAPNIGFSEFDFYDLYRSTFEKSELGRMKKLLPLHAMAENFGLVSKSLRPRLGRKSYFTPEGKVALMFLKMYTDATCYESEMRYLTDPKLLWEGIEKSYETMCELSHRPRTKFIDVQKANLTYRKQRKHSKSQTRKMTRRLLELLGKILKEIRKTERAYENARSLLTPREKGDLEIITKMYRQQKNHFQSKDCIESITNRIVSISKPYVRPIVRGKEVKSVEFGAKVINILVDGISFIEDLASVRATEMEGSFGTQKEHYDLRRVKARTKLTEILYIFFGFHTANVVQLADRIEQRAQLAAS